MEALPFSITQLNNVLSRGTEETPHACNFRRCSCQELAQLEYDPVAQVLSYYPVSFIPTLPGRFAHTISHHTLAAVSPRVRLYAEALVLRSSTDTGFEGTQVSEGQLVYWIALQGRGVSLSRLEVTLWWSEGCGLPIVLNAPNACRRLLSVLSGRWRRQVRRLRLLLRATPISDSVDAADGSDNNKRAGLNESDEAGSEGGEFSWSGRERRHLSMRGLRSVAVDTSTPVRLSSSTFLNALTSFSSLTRLSIAGEYAVDPVRSAAAVTEALRVVHCTPVAEVELWLCKDVTSLSNLAGAPLLEKLTVCGSGISDLHGLAQCPRLSFVDVSHNKLLTDLSGLAGAPRLTELRCVGCAVTCVAKLHCCPRLRCLDLSDNGGFSSLCELAEAPQLQSVCLAGTAVSDLADLCRCLSLVKVDVRGCRRLRRLPPSLSFDVVADVPL